MSGPETSRVQSLFEWLEIATEQLSGPAKERIRLEIEAHFADGVASHQAAGCSEAEARVSALAELGRPQSAAKRFRRQHLTKKEAKRVHEILEDSRRTVVFVRRCVTYAFFYVLLAFDLVRGRHYTGLVFITFGLLVCTGLATHGFIVARRNCSTFDIHSIFLGHMAHNGCVAILFNGAAFAGEGLNFFILFMLPQSLKLVPDLCVWRKLSQLHTVWPKTSSLKYDKQRN